MAQLASCITFKSTMLLCISIDRWCGNGSRMDGAMRSAAVGSVSQEQLRNGVKVWSGILDNKSSKFRLRAER
jgi:hypothetical protein